MTTLSLAVIVIMLISRLPLLALDRRIYFWEAALCWFIQALLVLCLVRGRLSSWALLAVAHACLHIGWWWLERRSGANLQLLRLASALVLILLAVSLGSPWAATDFRDYRPLLEGLGRYFSPAKLLLTLSWRQGLATTFGLLLCLEESNALIRWAVEAMELKPQESSRESGLVAGNEYRRGRFIGVLERFTVFFLVLGAQYSAVAFAITAKAMARFKSLDDRDFAEYFLLGTLLSVVLAGASALMVKMF